MTTDKTIAFIRHNYNHISEAYSKQQAHAMWQFVEGMILMAAAHYIIDFATETMLKKEAKDLYENYVDTVPSHS